MSLQTIITATLCAVIVVGTVGIFRKVSAGNERRGRVVIMVVCLFSFWQCYICFAGH